jgi:asparagine synthase (glutamine-hydrolysing)
MVIKADIALRDLSFQPSWNDGHVTVGNSRITPYPHDSLETLLVRATDQWFVIVRERQASSHQLSVTPRGAFIPEHVDDAEFHRLYQECVLWPLDYIMVEVARAGHRLRIRAGVLGSVPVYCRATDDRVTVSWDSGDLASGPVAIDAEIASHRLALHTIYSARQLCVGVTMLTERASLHVEPGRATYRYPEPVAESFPSEDLAERDVLQAFSDALHRAVSMRPLAKGGTSIELSGGMDSATVATTLAMHGEGIASKGILLDGAVRAPQVERRTAIVRRLGLLDDTVDITSYPPELDLAVAPDQPYGFYRDFYLEACSALWSSASAQGRHILLTGIGGDELFPAYASEMSTAGIQNPEWVHQSSVYAESLMTPHALNAARSLRTFDAPASPVPTTSLLAHACRSSDLLRHGQWPINPLSDPRLVAFCHRLPKDSRRGREVMRQYLQSHLGSDVFARGYVKETFADVLPPLVSLHAKSLARQLGECALADLGLVNRKAVLDLLLKVVETRAHSPTSAFASFLSLERSARQASS